MASLASSDGARGDDPHSMVVESVWRDLDGKRERVRITVPGVLVSDADFVRAYDFGRELYESEGGDLTDEEVIAFVTDVMKDYHPRHPALLVERAGLLFGYIAACIEEAR